MGFKKPVCSVVLSWALFAATCAIFCGCVETVYIRTPPPPIPYYEQPYCPGPGYLWVPGYWAYGPDGYYWVPGMWEISPRVGWLWTPGYWGWSDGVYIWHSGYWGRHIGYYGGINYGYGYSGVGYVGGYWRDNEFYYNSAVTRVNVTVVSNTYSTSVVENRAPVAVVSYNGGKGGVVSSPTNEELAAAREQHIAATPLQRQHVRAAGRTPELLASKNQGQPRPDLLAKRLAPVPAKAKIAKPKPPRKNKQKHPDNRTDSKPPRDEAR